MHHSWCTKFLYPLRNLLDNKCPPDVAKLTFYQFVKSPLGADFTTMVSLGGPLNPAQWDHYERWWLRNREDVNSKLQIRGEQSDWVMFVAWRAKLFMHIFLGIQKNMVINITAVTLEQLIWDFTALRNILLELRLIVEDDLEKPSTYFQKVAVMGELYALIRNFEFKI